MLINNQVFIRRFVIFTFCVTAIHFIFESSYTIQFGQSFLGLLPDLIADALLVTGGVLVLKNSKAVGIFVRGMGIYFLSALSSLGMEIWVSARRFCNFSKWNNNDCLGVHYVYFNILLYSESINVFAKKRLVLFAVVNKTVTVEQPSDCLI